MASLADGFITLVDGMDEGKQPSLISETSYARGVNVACRGGFVHTRPAFVKVPVELPTGSLQGSGLWSLNSGDRVVMVISGQVAVVNVTTNAVVVVTENVSLNAYAPCYVEQVDRYVVIMDGVSEVPAVLEESDAGVIQALAINNDTTHQNVAGEAVYYIPGGTIMKYAHGRLHFVPITVPDSDPAVSGRPYFLSSDIMMPLSPENALNYSEGTYLNEGGAHALPLEMGYIGGIGILRNSASGTGLGELIVFGRTGVCAFDMSIDRRYWSSQALSSVLYFGGGTVSPNAIVNMNNDLIYRSTDGLRSMRHSAQQGQASLSCTPMSNEVRSLMEDPVDSLPFISGAVAEHRALFTAHAVDIRYFKALVALDTAVLYDKQQTATPAYDGFWTGLDIGRVIAASVDGRVCPFAVTKGPFLWMLDDTATADNHAYPIQSTVYTRMFYGKSSNGASGLMEYKKIDYADLWLSDIRRPVGVIVYYRPEGYPYWSVLGTRKIVAPVSSTPTQMRKRLRLGLDYSNLTCDPVTGDALSLGYGFQFAIRFTGYCQIDRFRVVFESQPEPARSACDETTAVAVTPGGTAGIELGDFDYEIPVTDQPDVDDPVKALAYSELAQSTMLDSAVTAALEARLDELFSLTQAYPAGAIVPISYLSDAPSGWAECNGQSVSISDNPILYAAIGTKYGPVSGDTFVLPDMRGLFVQGWDGVSTVGTVTAAASQSHTHVMSESGHTERGPARIMPQAGVATSTFANYQSNTETGTVSTLDPVNVALKYFIKLG